MGPEDATAAAFVTTALAASAWAFLLHLGRARREREESRLGRFWAEMNRDMSRVRLLVENSYRKHMALTITGEREVSADEQPLRSAAVAEGGVAAGVYADWLDEHGLPTEATMWRGVMEGRSPTTSAPSVGPSDPKASYEPRYILR